MNRRRHWPDIHDLLLAMGVSPRSLRRLNRVKRADRPKCGARRRDGDSCRAPAVWDPVRGKPAHGGRCKLHGGKSTGPRTPEGRAAIAASNRRRAKAVL
jgi:hypothetical protein